MASLASDWPRHFLFMSFLAWKFLLSLVVIGSSLGSAYDTSTTLMQPHVSSFNESVFGLATKLTRWDAIFFIQSARRGYTFEQEWAFGLGLPTSISALVRGSSVTVP